MYTIITYISEPLWKIEYNLWKSSSQGLLNILLQKYMQYKTVFKTQNQWDTVQYVQFIHRGTLFPWWLVTDPSTVNTGVQEESIVTAPGTHNTVFFGNGSLINETFNLRLFYYVVTKWQSMVGALQFIVADALPLSKHIMPFWMVWPTLWASPSSKRWLPSSSSCALL